MFSTSTVILDCGSSRTAVGRFECSRGRLHCVAYAQETFVAPAENEAQWFESTRAALHALRPRFPLAGPVGVVLPGHLTLLKLIPVPRSARRKREKILRFAAEQNLSISLNEVVWDGTVVGAHDQVHEVLLAAAKLGVIEPFCALAQAAGYEPQWILPAPLATLAGYRLAGQASAAASVVLNLGARSTSLLLLGAGVGSVRTLPFGGNQLTGHLAEREECEFWQAEERKLAAKNLLLAPEATTAYAARLAQEISRTLENNSGRQQESAPARIFLTGGGARLAGLIPALTARLKLPVELLSVGGAIEFSDPGERPDAAVESLELTDLIGAAATQFLPDLPKLNLLPLRRQIDAKNRRRQPWLLAAAALLVASLIPLIFQEHHGAKQARRELARLEQILTPLRVQAASNAANLRQIAACRQEVAQLQALVDRRSSWLGLLADLQGCLGPVQDVWLDRLQVMPASPGAPLQLSLAGRMLNRAALRSSSGRGNTSRLKALLQAIDRLPGLSVAPQGRHFDHSQPGLTPFEFIVVVDPSHPL